MNGFTASAAVFGMCVTVLRAYNQCDREHTTIVTASILPV